MTNPQTVSSTISDVTIFRCGAKLTRVVSLGSSQAAGQLKIQDLPLALDDASVRVRLRCEDSTKPLLATATRDVLDVPERHGHENADDQALEEAQKTEEHLAARLLQVEEELQNLAELQVPGRPEGKRGQKPPQSSTKARLEWIAFLRKQTDELSAAAEKLHVQKRQATQERMELEERLKRASEAKEAKAHELRKALLVDLKGPPQQATLEIDYLVPGARWAPAYTLTLDGTMTKASLALRAMVCQKSGEDWSGIKNLKLTTAEPLHWYELPELSSLRIGRKQPPVPKRGFRPPPVGAQTLYADFDRHLAPSPSSSVPPPPLAEPEDLFDDEVTPVAGGPPPMGAGPHQPCPARLEMMKEEIDDDLHDAPLPAMEAQPFYAPAPVAQKSSGIGGLIGGLLDRAGPPASSAPQNMPRAKKRRARAESETLTGGYVSNSFESMEANAVAAEDHLLAYGELRMPGPEEESRGQLTLMSREQVALALVVSRQVGLAFDPFSVVSQAADAAAEVSGFVPPEGHSYPDTFSGFAHAYQSQSLVDIPADGTFHSIPITAASLDLALIHVTVPRMDDHVYRFAEGKNPLDSAPLLEGPVDVYVEGRYLLSSRMRRTAAAGTLRLGLGQEPQIKVARNTSFGEEAKGLIKGSLNLEHSIRIEVRNNLDRPARVEVRDRVPVTRKEEEEITVEVRKVDPPWRDLDQPEHPLKGGQKWTITVPEGEKQVLRADYTIRIPSKFELVGGNRREGE